MSSSVEGRFTTGKRKNKKEMVAVRVSAQAIRGRRFRGAPGTRWSGARLLGSLRWAFRCCSSVASPVVEEKPTGARVVSSSDGPRRRRVTVDDDVAGDDEGLMDHRHADSD
ncbi:hypothetical protein Dimus_008164 [Dionaea muscipula]